MANLEVLENKLISSILNYAEVKEFEIIISGISAEEDDSVKFDNELESILIDVKNKKIIIK